MNQIKNKWNKVPKGAKILSYVLLGVIGVTLMGVVFGVAIKLLWNWLMPELFNLKEINYWQAIGIFILAKLILGFGGSGENKGMKKERKDNKLKENYEPTQNKQESKSWMFYEEWWEFEGKKGFEDFIEKRNDNSSDN